MTWTTRILALLNIIAAGVLFYAAGRCYYQRQVWNQFIQAGEKLRDGDKTTADWIKSLSDTDLAALVERVQITDQLLDRLSPSDRAKVERYEQNKQRDEAARRGRGDNVPYRPKSEDQVRMGLSRLRYNPEAPKNDDAGKLLLEREGLEQLAKDLGPAGFTRLLREAILMNHPKLASEERELSERKAALVRVKEQYLADIAIITEETKRLQERLEAEVVLRDRTQFENAERRREITQLLAEIEESLHARDVALGRENDARRQLEEVQNRIQKLLEDNDRMEQMLRSSELRSTSSVRASKD